MPHAVEDIDRHILNRPISIEEVRSSVDEAKLCKAAGTDAFPAEAFKNEGCISMFSIISSCFLNGVVPALSQCPSVPALSLQNGEKA